MTTLASDHSTGGAIIGGSLKKAGFGAGVIRYACAGRGNVNITPAEVRDLHINGIPVAIVLEHEADWIIRPGVAGRAISSRQITRACGLPDGPIYCAADFDATRGGPTRPGSPGDQVMQAIARSLALVAGAIGRRDTAFYGSFFAIDWLIRHGWGDILFWQTEAWSWGNRHPAASLFQRAQSRTVARVQVDVDEIWKPHWGQRTASPAKPAPRPAPARKWASAELVLSGGEHVEVQFDVDRHVWRSTGPPIRPLPWNAPPLGR